jgi:hypothetical protein
VIISITGMRTWCMSYGFNFRWLTHGRGLIKQQRRITRPALLSTYVHMTSARDSVGKGAVRQCCLRIACFVLAFKLPFPTTMSQKSQEMQM